MSSSDSFPSGSWTLYFHDPADSSWTKDSYKIIGSFRSFPELWATIGAASSRIPDTKILNGMFFLMRDPYLPLWESKANIRGGSYSVKVPEKASSETFSRYMAAAALNLISKDEKNQIVGVSISPKRGFHIIKIWNTDSRAFHSPADINIYGDGMIVSDVIYRPHVDQKM